MSDDDSYTYPGSGGVLINRRGIRDAAELDRALNGYVSVRWASLLAEPVPDPPDFTYLCKIHRQLLGDLLSWAGELRTTDAQAVGAGVAYCRPAFIQPELDRLFAQLDAEDYLTGLGVRDFAHQLAERWGDLTAIHPFRDGNTRTQSAWVSAVAQRAGHQFDWSRVNVDVLRELRVYAVTSSSMPLAEYIETVLVTR